MNEDMVRRWVRELADRDEPISEDERNDLVMNSYEREFILPNLSDEALFKTLEYYIQNCRALSDPSRPASTYDEAVIYRLAPELMRRLRSRKL